MALMMEALCSFETLVTISQHPRRLESKCQNSYAVHNTSSPHTYRFYTHDRFSPQLSHASEHSCKLVYVQHFQLQLNLSESHE
jgi:hypothetical protein